MFSFFGIDRSQNLAPVAALAFVAFGCGVAATRAPASGSALVAERDVAIPAAIDGLIIRGRWRASIALGAPSLRFVASAADMHAVLLARNGTTLTIVDARTGASGPTPEIRVRVPHLRGVAASGAVALTLEDRSAAPLFLDLSGTGTARATGAVPLLRVTTSGSVVADLTALSATIARVHARQQSRLAIRARDALTIVALDSARVSYAAKVVHSSARDAAICGRCERNALSHVKRPKAQLFLDAVVRRDAPVDGAVFPWSLPLVRDFSHLEFSKRVTFFVGENGSGKSTLLEAMAVAAGAIALGGADLQTDPTLAAARALAAGLKLVRRGRPKATLYMRAEDVFGYTGRLAREMHDLEQSAAAFTGTRAFTYVAGQRAALVNRYGADPGARSHGETFLALLEARVVPAGLYFLDEPETPLSPIRILALMAILSDAVATGSQFVIATHSPILMALPDAALLQFGDGRVDPVAYEDVEHVRVTRDFLNAPARYLRHLTSPEHSD